jgi:3-dehydroquinate dehydratase
VKLYCEGWLFLTELTDFHSLREGSLMLALTISAAFYSCTLGKREVFVRYSYTSDTLAGYISGLNIKGIKALLLLNNVDKK